MSIKVRLNMPLQKLAGGKKMVKVSGNTVRECLNDLIKILPGAENNIFYKNGYLRPLILINNAHFPQDELDREVKDGDELWMITMMFGG
jgi:molybdopterin converting factor small subunit